MIPAFLDTALKGEPLQVHGDGQQTRVFTFVGTFTQIISDAVIRKVTHHSAVNLVLGSRASLMEPIDEMNSLLGTEVQVEHTEPRVCATPKRTTAGCEATSLMCSQYPCARTWPQPSTGSAPRSRRPIAAALVR